MYKILADVVVILHLSFIVFVVAGGFMALKWPRLIYLHMPAVLWGAYIEFSGRICPLTPLENWLRRISGLSDYEGDFIGRYLLPIIYPADLTRDVQFILGVSVIVINVVAYTLLVLKHRRRH